MLSSPACMARAKKRKMRTFVIKPHSIDSESFHSRAGFILKFQGNGKRVTIDLEGDYWIGEIAKKLHTALKRREDCLSEQRQQLEGVE